MNKMKRIQMFKVFIGMQIKKKIFILF